MLKGKFMKINSQLILIIHHRAIMEHISPVDYGMLMKNNNLFFLILLNRQSHLWIIPEVILRSLLSSV